MNFSRGWLALLPLVVAGALQAQAPASSPYASYPSPVSCLATLMRVENSHGWNAPIDTMPFNPNDMLTQTARDTAARCLQRFYPAGPRVAQVPEHEVATLFFWGRATGDDSLAAAAFRRALGQQKLRVDSIDLTWHATHSYAARPYRLPVSQAMAVRLDKFGVVGERPFLPYDDHWESQHNSPNGLAFPLFDTTAMRIEGQGELRNYEALPDTARHGAEMTGISTATRNLLLELVRNPRADSAVKAMKARAIEVLGPDQQQGRWGEAMLLLGDRYAPIKPDFWFNRPGGDSTFPRPGRVTVIQPIGVQQCICEATFAAIRRLKQRFGDSIDVVVLVQTNGHWARRVQLTPAEEAQLISAAVIDGAKLPVALGVYTTTFVPNPAPDNRLVAQVIPELRHIRFGSSAVLVDRRGITQLAGVVDLGPWSERALNAVVASLLSAPAD